ncbi:MAG TPA: VCBS repeat-containing protein, partial [Pyrinomonadaceae bacterium]|nr:VCBS repeat-containing protein [Pyrinomonadaceae bacterium]
SATVGGGTLLVNSNTATATIVSCTIVSNSASSNGGAIRVTAGNLAMGNTIVANNNAPTNPDVSGNVTSQGYNLIKNTTGAVITGITTGNLTGVDPTLELFSDNGGGMFTSAPSRSSIVVDAGDPGRSSDLDQRRARRNTDGNLNGIAGVDIGAIEKQRTAYDADGEDSADLSVTRVDQNTNYVWYSGMRIVNSFVELMDTNPNAYFQQKFGLSTDTKVPGDYDGDGRMDPAVYRASQGLWYIFGSTSGLTVLQWGLPNDVPVPADYDGDGRTDIATYRAGVWYVLKSTQGFTGAVTLGTATDKPVPADYDGDLKTDIAIFGNGVWTINRSTAGPTSAQFGITGDVPVPADYSGDGIDDLAVFRPNSGTWYIQKVGGFDAFPFGLATDKLVPADYDGDGKIDIAVWRSNTMTGKGDWYVQRSRDGYTLANFGFSTDVPTQNALIRQ